MDSNIQKICQCMEILTSKESKEREEVSAADSKDSLDVALLQRIDKVKEKINEDSSLLNLIQEIHRDILSSDLQQIQWHFIEWCLVLLSLLKTFLEEASKKSPDPPKLLKPSDGPSMPPAILSISQQKTVQNVSQFIVAVGIEPNLLPGVGIPLSTRSEFADVMQKSRLSLEPWQKYRHLVSAVWVLLMCTKQFTLNSIILHKHLVDVLAALLQLCFAPIKQLQGDFRKQQAESLPRKTRDIHEFLENCKVSSRPCDNELILEMHDDRKMFHEELKNLLDKVYQPLLVRELLLIQSPLKSRQKALQKVPAWLKKNCGQLLTRSLLKKNGMAYVIQGILDSWSVSSTTDDINNLDWAKCEAVAKLIARPPSQSASVQEYYESISTQMINLLQSKATSTDRVNYRISCCILTCMLEDQPCLTAFCFFRRILQPLLQCLSSSDHMNMFCEGDVIVSEKIVDKCFDTIHKITCLTEPSKILFDAFLPIFHLLFEFAACSHGTVSYLRGSCQDILKSIIHSQEMEYAIQLLHYSIFGCPEVEEIEKLDQCIQICLAEEGGLKIVKRFRTKSDEEWLQQVDRISQCVTLILGAKSDKRLALHFFFSLLKKLTKTINATCDSGDDKKSEEPLFEMDCRSKELRQNLLLVHLIQALSDEVCDQLEKDKSALINFILETLERACQVTGSTELQFLISESVLLSLSALGVLLSGENEMEKEDIEAIKKCLPSLKSLAKNHSNSEIRSMCQNLQTSLTSLEPKKCHWAKKGSTSLKENSLQDISASVSDTLKQNSILREIRKGYGLKVLPAQKSSETITSVVAESKEIIDSNDGADNKESSDITSTSHNKQRRDDAKEKRFFNPKNPTSSTFELTWKELHDPLVPVRGHAFLTLRRLIDQRNMEALAKKQELIDLCKESIQEEDSYIYLGAINALAALADLAPDSLLPVLADEILDKEHHTLEVKLKLGEVFMKTSFRLGDMTPKYKDLLISCFLGATKDPDPDLRASAFSNLGEAIKQLRFSVHSSIQEILDCIKNHIARDPSENVKRAAVMTFTLMFRGMGKDILEFIPEEMKEIYRVLKHLYNTSSDDRTKLQAQVALQDLNEVMKDFFTPQSSLEKHIKVLSL